jgi:hypothetical protein
VVRTVLSAMPNTQAQRTTISHRSSLEYGCRDPRTLRAARLRSKNRRVHYHLAIVWSSPSAQTHSDSTGDPSSLAKIGSADWVQTNGFGLALCSAR